MACKKKPSANHIMDVPFFEDYVLLFEDSEGSED
jgi:hypothetical protein